MTELLIDCPEFYSEKDEESFFAWLGSIAAIESVVGVGRQLRLRIERDAVDDTELRELLALFHRHKIHMSVLRDFETEGNRSWFRNNPHAYWHADVFGTDEGSRPKIAAAWQR